MSLSVVIEVGQMAHAEVRTRGSEQWTIAWPGETDGNCDWRKRSYRGLRTSGFAFAVSLLCL